MSAGSGLFEELRRLGSVEGRNLVVEQYSSESRAFRNPESREQPAAQSGVRPDAGQAHPSRSCAGKLLSPALTRDGMTWAANAIRSSWGTCPGKAPLVALAVHFHDCLSSKYANSDLMTVDSFARSWLTTRSYTCGFLTTCFLRSRRSSRHGAASIYALRCHGPKPESALDIMLVVNMNLSSFARAAISLRRKNICAHRRSLSDVRWRPVMVSTLRPRTITGIAQNRTGSRR